MSVCTSYSGALCRGVVNGSSSFALTGRELSNRRVAGRIDRVCCAFRSSRTADDALREAITIALPREELDGVGFSIEGENLVERPLLLVRARLKLVEVAQDVGLLSPHILLHDWLPEKNRATTSCRGELFPEHSLKLERRTSSNPIPQLSWLHIGQLVPAGFSFLLSFDIVSLLTPSNFANMSFVTRRALSTLIPPKVCFSFCKLPVSTGF